VRRSRIKAFLVASTKSFFKDKGSVFWVIAWPIILVLMSAYVFIPPSAGSPMAMKLGVVNHDTSRSPFNGSSLVSVLGNVKYNGTRLFKIKVYKAEEDMLADLDKGKLDAGIIIPSGFGRNLTLGTALLKAYVGGKSVYSIQVNRGILESFLCGFAREIGLRKANIALNYISGVPSNWTHPPQFNATFKEFVYRFMVGLVEPINTTLVEKAPKALTERPRILGWYVLGAVGMMMLYSGFSLGATAIVEEKEKGRLERILSTPSTPADLLAGKMFSGLLILLLSSIVIILSGLAVQAEVRWNPLRPADLLVLLHFLLLGVMTISMGFLLSLVSKTTKGAGNLAVGLGLLLSFTAGIWFPKEWMPGALRMLADVFPPTWSLDAIRDIVVYRAGIGDVALLTVESLAATLIFFLLGVEAYRRVIRRYVEA